MMTTLAFTLLPLLAGGHGGPVSPAVVPPLPLVAAEEAVVVDSAAAEDGLASTWPPMDGGTGGPARYPNLTPGGTDRDGLWIDRDELASRPTSGPAWTSLLEAADAPCGSVDLSDKDQVTNVCVMAKALVYARTARSSYAEGVVSAISDIVSAPTYDGSALSLGRELGSYVIAADLIALARLDPGLDEAFRDVLRRLRTTYTHGGPSSLIDCHERRPNNWGTHCGGTRAAIAAYLGDTADLDRTAQVFRGWLGDRSSYAGFSFGDLSWQCDSTRPVGIGPPGCTRDGRDLAGVVADDQRRGGHFTWPPPKENYVWEALQGALMQAVILERAGYPAFEWQDKALLRAVRWLHEAADYPAEGDDTWQPHVINHVYGTSFPAPVPARPGKNVGWTDWTHGRQARSFDGPHPPDVDAAAMLE